MLRLLKHLLLTIYGVYAWITFLVLSLIALVLMLVVPGLNARRLIGAGCAKLWLKIAAINIEVRGLKLLPQEPAIIVANHASYVDGVILKAILPARYSFVIKKEMVRVPLAGFLLRRIGAEFVDRFNRHSGAMDARRLLRAASQGSSLVFFPEGTFTASPGLARFHGGAFTIAARSRIPVMPLVIHGTRRILCGDSLWPRPGNVFIEVLPMVTASEADDSQARVATLRDQSRMRILLALGEPDLADDAALPPHTQSVDAN